MVYHGVGLDEMGGENTMLALSVAWMIPGGHVGFVVVVECMLGAHLKAEFQSTPNGYCER